MNGLQEHINIEYNIDCHEFNYLSDVEHEFPIEENINFQRTLSVINKGRTGCGGTTLFMNTMFKRKERFVMAMPYVAAIKSKENDNTVAKNKVSFLYGDNNEFGNGDSIVCTYDKLPKVIERIDTRTYHFILDEYHTVARDNHWRDAMDYLNKRDLWMMQWKSVTIMSATPNGFANSITGHFDKVVTRNYMFKPFEVVFAKCYGKPVDTFIAQLRAGIHGGYRMERNYYIVLNSIKDIKRMITKLGIQESSYYVMCSEARNDVKVTSPELSRRSRIWYCPRNPLFRQSEG